MVFILLRVRGGLSVCLITPTVTLDLLSISIDMVAILFSPNARVYNLRILLLALVVDAVLGSLVWGSFYRDIVVFLMGSNAIFAVHHVVAYVVS